MNYWYIDSMVGSTEFTFYSIKNYFTNSKWSALLNYFFHLLIYILWYYYWRWKFKCWELGLIKQNVLLWLYMYKLMRVAFFSAGFNVETVEYKNISFTVWDVGGQDKVIIGWIICQILSHLIFWVLLNFDISFTS